MCWACEGLDEPTAGEWEAIGNRAATYLPQIIEDLQGFGDQMPEALRDQLGDTAVEMARYSLYALEKAGKGEAAIGLRAILDRIEVGLRDKIQKMGG